MSEPTDPAMQAYIQANAGRFTDEALVEALVQAGHDPAAARAAGAAASAVQAGPTSRSRAVRSIVIAYIAVFAILSVGMLLNSGSGANAFIPSGSGGIAILAASLGVAFGLSMIWIASRRAFLLGVALILGLIGAGILASSGLYGAIPLAIAIGIGVLVFRSGPAPAGPSTTTVGVLLVIPLLLLLAVGGICVASGLPIPRVG
jgi:hypothetical protein